MYYYSIKHFHVLFVVLSITFVLLRTFGLNTGSHWTQQRWLKILHYGVNSLMAVLGFTLAAMLGASQPWMLMKIVGMSLYLLAALFAVQTHRSAIGRVYALVIAVVIYAYTIGVAFSHSPASWFANTGI